jgi:signal transduction histidine kinase
MNLKFRLAALYTLFVGLIIVIISFSFYYYFSEYQSASLNRSLRDEGIVFYNQYTTVKAGHKDSVFPILRIFNIRRKALSKEQVTLLDINKKVLYFEPDTGNVELNAGIIKNFPLNSGEEHYFQSGDRKVFVTLLDDKYYVAVSVVDKYGIESLGLLRLILMGLLIGGLILTAFASFFFVNAAFKPLASLSMQMQLTTETNLTARVHEGKGNDEIQQIARNFNGMLERLNQSFESQKSFVHHASHELRTPLTTMLSQTEIALSKDLDLEEHRKLLESLREDQVGMIELTNSLLLLSQYEKIQSYSKWPQLRIDEVLYETIGSARKMLPGVDISLDFANIPDDENELVIQGNDALLKVGFTNLIKNAWQYSADKKVKVIIDATPDYMKVYVENNGKHLSTSEIEKLKVPFFRGSNAAHVKGFGLGLSIVQRIILLHHGSFDYTALKPSVNRFTIYFRQK